VATEPIVVLIVTMLAPIIPMGMVVMLPGLPRRPLALATGTWGAVHGTVWLLALYLFGKGDALSVYTSFNAYIGMAVTGVILVWPRKDFWKKLWGSCKWTNGSEGTPKKKQKSAECPNMGEASSYYSDWKGSGAKKPRKMQKKKRRNKQCGVIMEVSQR